MLDIAPNTSRYRETKISTYRVKCRFPSIPLYPCVFDADNERNVKVSTDRISKSSRFGISFCRYCIGLGIQRVSIILYTRGGGVRNVYSKCRYSYVMSKCYDFIFVDRFRVELGFRSITITMTLVRRGVESLRRKA